MSADQKDDGIHRQRRLLDADAVLGACKRDGEKFPFGGEILDRFDRGLCEAEGDVLEHVVAEIEEGEKELEESNKSYT